VEKDAGEQVAHRLRCKGKEWHGKERGIGVNPSVHLEEKIVRMPSPPGMAKREGKRLCSILLRISALHGEA